jgi:hypothetical protein
MKKFEMSMTILYFTVGCSAFCLIPFLVIGKDYLGASSVFVCALSLLVNGFVFAKNLGLGVNIPCRMGWHKWGKQSKYQYTAAKQCKKCGHIMIMVKDEVCDL